MQSGWWRGKLVYEMLGRCDGDDGASSQLSMLLLVQVSSESPVQQTSSPPITMQALLSLLTSKYTRFIKQLSLLQGPIVAQPARISISSKSKWSIGIQECNKKQRHSCCCPTPLLRADKNADRMMIVIAWPKSARPNDIETSNNSSLRELQRLPG